MDLLQALELPGWDSRPTRLRARGFPVSHRAPVRRAVMPAMSVDGSGNDADALRSDPMFKLAMEHLPGDADLCSRSTISRTENLPDARALLRI